VLEVRKGLCHSILGLGVDLAFLAMGPLGPLWWIEAELQKRYQGSPLVSDEWISSITKQSTNRNKYVSLSYHSQELYVLELHNPTTSALDLNASLENT
jgi:hypothetical protein